MSFDRRKICNAFEHILIKHSYYSRDADTMQVISGSIDLRDPQSTHDIEEVRMHKYYNPRDYWINDIALIKVNDET